VRLQNYVSMPHAFTIFAEHSSSKAFYRECAKFIQDVTGGAELKTHMEIVNGKGIVEQNPLDPEQYFLAFTKEDVRPCRRNNPR
jgi:hypothetical protein